MTRILLCLALLFQPQSLRVGPSKRVGPTLRTQGAASTVAFDNSNIGSTANASGTTLSFNLTIGSGSNRAIGIGCAFAALVSSEAVTVGGTNAPIVSGTRVQVFSQETIMFALAAPASGSQTVAVSWTTAAAAVCTAISVTGVDQITPAQNGTNNGGFTACPCSSTLTINSATGDMGMDIISVQSANAPTASLQTSRQAGAGFFMAAGSSTGPGAATIGFGWTAQTFGSESGFDFKHA